MGLAASQARLLTITSRKADCEFESMRLSHEKIALSRDMERISDEYQNAMNQTKLIYDYYGTGTSDMALTYGLLMTPSVYNDYYPRLLTDKSNRVVLSSVYASAAKAAGIPVEGYNGTPSSEVRNKFIEALRDRGVISAASAASIESVSYNNAVGLGATFSATAATQDITYNEFLDLIKAKCVDTSDYGDTLPLNGSYKAISYPNTVYESDGANGDYWNIMVYDSEYGGNYSLITNTYKASISLYDLLTTDKQYIYQMTTTRGPTIPVTEAALMQQVLVGNEQSPSFLNWITDQFSAILGGVTENDLALQYAYDRVSELIYPSEKIQDTAARWYDYGYAEWDNADWSRTNYGHNTEGSEWHDLLPEIATKAAHAYECEGVNGECTSNACNYLGVVYSSCGSGSRNGKNRRQTIAVDLNTVVQTFLTAFMEYQQGLENSKYSYENGQVKHEQDGRTIANLYEANSEDIFKIKAPTDVADGTDNLLAGFYDTLFNRICMSGWTENENIENLEYMQELMKSGAVYISSMANDGNYYQSSYSTDTYISEVSDLEGIAQAEARYNAAKARIENKENTIDLKIKNLDTEISSLTTEYDTMKGLISKTIEKSFKRYEA